MYDNDEILLLLDDDLFFYERTETECSKKSIQTPWASGSETVPSER